MKNYEINSLAYTRTERAKELAKERSRRYREKNKDKIKAHNHTKLSTDEVRARKTYSNAIRDGIISRLSYCEICGNRNMVEAHHFDYKKPLDVIYLCQQHHKDIHKYFRIVMKKYNTK